MNERPAPPQTEELPPFRRDLLGSGEPVRGAGRGPMGGKATGLHRAHRVLSRAFPDGTFENLGVGVPSCVVLGAEAFDLFVTRNDLRELALEEERDERIANAFQRAEIPVELAGDLRGLVRGAAVPLAVRSSSLLEDATGEPFAGVYATKMIPNNQPSTDERFRRLVEAVKFVYASTYFREAKGYRRITGRGPDEERMAVVVQEVMGIASQDRFYPTISGVARSRNFYPFGRARPEEGVVDLALGLGKQIVDGGRCWTYSPAHPQVGPPAPVADLLKQTQTEFWAVNLDRPKTYDPLTEVEYLVRAGLAEAEFDGALSFVASTFDPANDRVVLGTGRPGPRLLDFGPVLRMDDWPLNALLRRLLAIFEDELGTEVEIEFAMNLDPLKKHPPRFGFLQVRGSPPLEEGEAVSEEELTGETVLLASDRALGHGRREDVRDVVYLRPATFDKSRTRECARDIGLVNRTFADGDAGYLLLSFGRIGTTDPWLGVPVDWSQISHARVLAEVAVPELDVDLSQGSHFFHNVTSLGLFFFQLHHAGPTRVDWDWLDAQPAVFETELLRHVRLPEPLTIRVDGRQRRGVVTR